MSRERLTPRRTLGPVALAGRHVRLEPLTPAHLPDLFHAGGGDEEVWRRLPVPMPRSREDLGMGRVSWRTDHLNIRSQQAVARLGAVREGVFRRNLSRPDGSWRDTVHYAMVGDQWPAAKERLAARLAAGRSPG